MALEEAGHERWLEELRAEYWSGLGAGDPEGETPGTPYVLFDLGERRFSVDARLCKGVVRKPPVARLPGVPPHVLGVAAIRGQVVSVTDPVVFLATPGEGHRGPGYLLLLSSGEARTALWVDRVRDVRLVRDDEFSPLEAPWPGAPPGVLVGQRLEGDRPLLAIDGSRYVEASAVGDPGPCG